MGLYVFRLPDIGEGVAEAEIVEWYVKIGDKIEEDQTLVDVMTDKATVDITSPVSGVVVAVHGNIGDQAAVGSTLVELEVEGTGNVDQAELVDVPETQAVEPSDKEAEEEPQPEFSSESSNPRKSEYRGGQVSADRYPLRNPGDDPLAAPATRKRAYELGIPLQFVPGTGPGGRITPDDLQSYIEQGGAGPVQSGHAKRTTVTEQKVIGLRRKIAEKMQDAKRRIPHFGFVEAFDLTELENLRKALNADRGEDTPKLTLLPFFMKAVAQLQSEFPEINARYDDEAGILYKYDGVHIGIAAQTPQGLMVPVVRHVESLNLWDCARELSRVTKAAREGTAARDELSGSTITLTSLGVLGGISATPIINAPEVAIIGPNKLEERPVVRDGQMVIRTMMNVSSSFDHRIVDGHDAASFIQRLKRLIERPTLIFLERP
ncbi:dihydrolipoamide acetyltransferase family protein [Marinobacter adhaerens]|jgi:2-oxoisovalerate dehydrogenase E2 component (dihydrolipoyl transacylase)|uniref:Dihydrolipoamide acetyltransferase component of pyruvate dehydrogenase complex n=2 Tax=Marinobacter adhaerens TaxID=1033846 RepID=A0ABX8IM52_9GAMM|nr:dihydrolipoamide acetyltransferase family protein [Marinobacter adhaerens]ADP95828.1 catalytic domain of components of various dehydrogenase complexes [Marinobacter adhaerens HP15]QWV13878.1 2-oxo acid dehydrogenase subunit E2 [Marinobacter adhaerens]